MNYRCPLCGKDLRKRRLTEAVVTRMEIECLHCKGVIRLNLHPAEMITVTLIFAALVILAVLGYWLESRGAVVAFLGVAMVGAGLMPALDKVFLRAWPRYAAK
jgi:DNA-directed RNA polymerase subunit RPC12/RpoP